MAKRETIAAADITTQYDLAQTLAAFAEGGRITSAQFRTLAGALAGYVPAHITLAQRTPKGAVYARIQAAGDTFALTVDHRAHMRYG